MRNCWVFLSKPLDHFTYMCHSFILKWEKIGGIKIGGDPFPWVSDVLDVFCNFLIKNGHITILFLFLVFGFFPLLLFGKWLHCKSLHALLHT